MLRQTGQSELPLAVLNLSLQLSFCLTKLALDVRYLLRMLPLQIRYRSLKGLYLAFKLVYLIHGYVLGLRKGRIKNADINSTSEITGTGPQARRMPGA